MFVLEFVKQKNILISKIKIKWFDDKTSTFAGYVVCKDEFEANKLYSALNERLIGDTVIQCSWEKKQDSSLVAREPSMPISALQLGSSSKIIRNPSITRKNKWTSVNSN